MIFSPFYLLAQSGNECSYVVEPYIMFPNISGTTAIGNVLELNVEVSSDPIFYINKTATIIVTVLLSAP